MRSICLMVYDMKMLFIGRLSRNKNLVGGGSLLGATFPIRGWISKFADSGSAIFLVGKILYIENYIYIYYICVYTVDTRFLTTSLPTLLFQRDPLFSNFDHFPHNTKILLSFYLISLIVLLNGWSGHIWCVISLLTLWIYTCQVLLP